MAPQPEFLKGSALSCAQGRVADEGDAPRPRARDARAAGARRRRARRRRARHRARGQRPGRAPAPGSAAGAPPQPGHDGLHERRAAHARPHFQLGLKC